MMESSLLDIFHSLRNVLLYIRENKPTRYNASFHSEITVAEALKEMRNHNFNKVLIKEGQEVLGVFSYRSFVEGLLNIEDKNQNPFLLNVEEFIENLQYAQTTDIPTDLLGEFELSNAVLVGSENNCLGIVTTFDTLQSFYDISSPFILLREIELSIRGLIKESINDEELNLCIEKSLKKHYEEKGLDIPNRLEDLSLNDFVMILRFKGTWDKFSPLFGMSSNLVYTRLKSIPKLKNDIVHYRREITEEEFDTLRYVRNWLLRRIRKLEVKRRE